MLISNGVFTEFSWFGFGYGGNKSYNDVLRQMYDALYRMNVGVDFVDPTSTNIEDYTLLIVPALYAAPDSLLNRLNLFVKNGGHIVYTLMKHLSYFVKPGAKRLATTGEFSDLLAFANLDKSIVIVAFNNDLKDKLLRIKI